MRRTNFSEMLRYKQSNSQQQQQQQQNRTCLIVNFAVPAAHWVELKESEKKDKYLEIARE